MFGYIRLCGFACQWKWSCVRRKSQCRRLACPRWGAGWQPHHCPKWTHGCFQWVSLRLAYFLALSHCSAMHAWSSSMQMQIHIIKINGKIVMGGSSIGPSMRLAETLASGRRLAGESHLSPTYLHCSMERKRERNGAELAINAYYICTSCQLLSRVWVKDFPALLEAFWDWAKGLYHAKPWTLAPLRSPGHQGHTHWNGNGGWTRGNPIHTEQSIRKFMTTRDGAGNSESNPNLE